MSNELALDIFSRACLELKKNGIPFTLQLNVLDENPKSFRSGSVPIYGGVSVESDVLADGENRVIYTRTAIYTDGVDQYDDNACVRKSTTTIDSYKPKDVPVATVTSNFTKLLTEGKLPE